MCGILFSSNPGCSKKLFNLALGEMNHRGPDADGYYKLGPFQLGHKRLKILDMDNRSNQPFFSKDGRYAIIFNGEIYNYLELAKAHNIPQRTTSDTEIIIELYAKYGHKFLPWLNGMFSFVILDKKKKEVFVARDRLGVKPLYMHRDGEKLTLASEIVSILKIIGQPKFDSIGLRQYMKLRTFFNGRTVYQGIEMFPAGSYMLSGRIHKYWELPELEQEPPSDDELRSLITASVEQRLRSDVPIGSYLSGGLDSTIIATLSKKPHTWTVGFNENNEFEWANLAAKYIGSTHHEVLINSKEFVDMGRKMIKQRCEPLSVPNEILIYKMTQEVKKENTVILSGEGADELFFGYDRIFRWAAENKVWDLAKFSELYAYGSHDDLEIIEDALSPFIHRKNPLDIVSNFFQIAHLHGLLRRLDNSTMICSVEARVPFVDYHPLIERMAGVSFDYRMKNGVVKDPLKRLFSNLIPNKIIQRKKIGFPVPLDNIEFGWPKAETPMDNWLQFNLSELCGMHISIADIKGEIL